MAPTLPPRRTVIDLTQFTLALTCPGIPDLTLQFNSPSRRFYLGVIALVVMEMKRLGRVASIPLKAHLDTLALLNNTVGNEAGSSAEGPLLTRIYLKWQQALPNLAEAPLFEIAGRKKGYDPGPGKAYDVTETEQDRWANLFGYQGSHEHVRLKFAVDTLGLTLDGVVVRYEDAVDREAWAQFLAHLHSQKKAAEPAAAEAVVPPIPPAPPAPWWRSRRVALVAIAVLLLLVVLAVVLGRSMLTRPAVASRARMAFPLPDEPSIAVLPFENLSRDAQQEVLSDAMTEGIITALARVPRFFVIARASTAQYKGKPVSIPEVSEALGVRYVLEGSVQRSGDRIRVTAQLIDALTGSHVWAQQYDRDRTDLFALQDDVTLHILASVRSTVLGGNPPDWDRVATNYYRGPRALECYVKVAEVDSYLIRWNIPDNNRARRLAEELIAFCPDNPDAYAKLAWAYHHDIMLGNTPSPADTLTQAIAVAHQGLALDEGCIDCHSVMGQLAFVAGDSAKAMAEGQRAVALSPGGAFALFNYATTLSDIGRPAEAIPLFEKTIRLSPFGPSSMYRAYGVALRETGRFVDAVVAYKKSLQIAPDNQQTHLGLAITYMRMGREPEARAEAASVLHANPNFSLAAWAKVAFPLNNAEREGIVEALRKAGLR